MSLNFSLAYWHEKRTVTAFFFELSLLEAVPATYIDYQRKTVTEIQSELSWRDTAFFLKF